MNGPGVFRPERDIPPERDGVTLHGELGQLLAGHLRALLNSTSSRGPRRIDLVDVEILRLLRGRGDARASFVADEFGLTRTSISRRVALLSQEGLIDQQPDPEDGRALLLELTEDGRQALQVSDATRQALIDELTADWSEADRALVASLLATLNERGRDYLEGASRGAGGGVLR
jgi:DNA-binding MarR family transcriptional regulator